MRARWLFLGLLIAFVLGLWVSHFLTTSLPPRVVIASGPIDGRYHSICLELAVEMEQRLGVEVEVLQTSGSLDNYHRLRAGEVDFALYQPDTARMLEDDEQPDDAAFVANLYSEIVHILVTERSAIRTAHDLRGKRVALGPAESGDSAISRMLLKHLGIAESDLAEAHHDLDYIQVEQQLASGELDAAFVSAGLQAPIFRKLADDPRAGIQVLPVPFAAALAMKHASTSPFVIPAGYLRTFPDPLPSADIETVAMRAKLLTRTNAPTALIERVTEILLDEHFQRSNELTELFGGGREFAASKPEFRMHPGAGHIYNPDLKPLLNPDFVEGTEGLRSFVVSILIAGWLTMRWLKQRRIRAQEHRLDRYIRSMLDIERRQLGLDESYDGKDSEPLQRLLDEVTDLRQDALREFSAHEINEDPSIACFVQMCHALSDKINAKLTRQRIDRYAGQTSQDPERFSTNP